MVEVESRRVSVSDIARALRKPPGYIHTMIEATGGFSPAERRRRRYALSKAEREEISRGLAAGEPLRAIVRRLGHYVSTICREVRLGGGREKYRATKADVKVWKRSLRPNRCRLSVNERL